jgi:hypothetical protein
MEKLENFKYAKIEKIIDKSYNVNKQFSIFNAESIEKSENLNKTFTRLTMPFKTDFELIKTIEIFAELTRYSFKRINIHKERKKDIVFVCSSVSPRKPGNEAACQGQAARSRKRLINESCPMRLKFMWDKELEQFELKGNSKFNHNHEALSDSYEVFFVCFILCIVKFFIYFHLMNCEIYLFCYMNFFLYFFHFFIFWF